MNEEELYFYKGQIEGSKSTLDLVDEVAKSIIEDLKDSRLPPPVHSLVVATLTTFAQKVRSVDEKGQAIFQAAIKHAPEDVEGYYKDMVETSASFNTEIK